METKKIVQKVGINFNEKQTEIFQKIINYNWVSMAFEINRTLSLMALTYIRSERIEGDPQNTRSDIAFYLEILQYLVEDLRKCELNCHDIDSKKEYFIDHITGFNSFWNEPGRAQEVKNTLFNISLEYIRSEEVEGQSKEYRDTVSLHFNLLMILVSDIHEMIFKTE